MGKHNNFFHGDFFPGVFLSGFDFQGFFTVYWIRLSSFCPHFAIYNKFCSLFSCIDTFSLLQIPFNSPKSPNRPLAPQFPSLNRVSFPKRTSKPYFIRHGIAPQRVAASEHVIFRFRLNLVGETFHHHNSVNHHSRRKWPWKFWEGVCPRNGGEKMRWKRVRNQRQATPSRRSPGFQ